jgi:hypothetical protein
MDIMDIVYIVIVIGFFALCWGLAELFDRI